MTAMRAMLRSATLAGGLCAGLALTGGPAAAAGQPVVATYDFYFGGLHILSSRAVFAQGEDAYDLRAEARTEGFVSVLFDWRGETATAGRFEAGRAVPARHESRGEVSGEPRRMELSYDEAGQIVDVVVEPPPDPDEVTPLPAGAELDTVDPLSVFAELGRAVASGEGCGGAYSVYDGKRRYELTVVDAGPRQLEASAYSIYSGPALACAVRWEMLGGERREKNKYSRTARDRTVYVARPFESATPIPVALTIETDYGTLKGHLTSVESGGRRMALSLD